MNEEEAKKRMINACISEGFCVTEGLLKVVCKAFDEKESPALLSGFEIDEIIKLNNEVLDRSKQINEILLRFQK